jgi:hypothetical protein
MFPGSRDKGQLVFLCAKFMDHCRSVYNDQQFLAAARMVERDSRFFPTVADIIAVRDSVYQQHQAQIAADMTRKVLPEETGNFTEEEVEQNQGKLEIIKKMLCGELTMEQAEAEQWKLTTYTRRGV